MSAVCVVLAKDAILCNLSLGQFFLRAILFYSYSRSLHILYTQGRRSSAYSRSLLIYAQKYFILGYMFGKARREWREDYARYKKELSQVEVHFAVALSALEDSFVYNSSPGHVIDAL